MALCLVACSKPTTSTPTPDATKSNAAAAGDTQHADCCKQCASSARRDPSGTRLEPTDCRKYMGTWNGQPGVDAACVAHFKDSPTTVGDCWTSFPELK